MESIRNFVTEEHDLKLTDLSSGSSFIHDCSFLTFKDNPNIYVTDYDNSTDSKCKKGFYLVYYYFENNMKKVDKRAISKEVFSDINLFFKVVKEFIDKKD